MPLYCAEALILRTYRLGEADRIVVFLTEDRGKKRGVAKGARRTRSRFVGALEPLTRVSVAYFEKERRELVSMNFAETLRSPLSARQPEALGYFGYFAELVDEWAPDASPNQRLFRLGAAIVEALAGPVPVERVARYFEYWLLRLEGVYPSIAACARCRASLAGGARLQPHARQFVCPRCSPGREAAELSAGAIAFLQAATAVAPDRLAALALDPQAARDLELAHRRLIAWHLEREPRASRVLREMCS